MKRKLLTLPVLLIAFIVVSLESCKYDNLEDLRGSCDTTQVTYNGTIVPILQNNCYGCHGTNSNSGSNGIILQDYNVLKTYAASGELYGNVAHLPGYNPMPYGGAKLPDCEIAKIKKWVDSGYLNN